MILRNAFVTPRHTDMTKRCWKEESNDVALNFRLPVEPPASLPAPSYVFWWIAKLV
jgi:hypothetical protein